MFLKQYALVMKHIEDKGLKKEFSELELGRLKSFATFVQRDGIEKGRANIEKVISIIKKFDDLVEKEFGY